MAEVAKDNVTSVSPTAPATLEKKDAATTEIRSNNCDVEKAPLAGEDIAAGGVARIEGMQVVWGKHGKKIIWFGMGAMLLA